MLFQNYSIYVRSFFGYLIIGLFFPFLWFQAKYLKRFVQRIPTPTDNPFGFIDGKNGTFKILGIGESPMAGVGIENHSETLTGLTALCINNLIDCKINWKIIAQNGLTIKKLNELIFLEHPIDADIIIASVGGNDVFNLTSPWVWKKQLASCVNFFVRNGESPIIIFSNVPCVGRFPAIPNPLRLAFGYWELLLQDTLTLFMRSTKDAYLLEDRFPDGEEYFMKDGIHPSKLAYSLWSKKLAKKTIEMINQKK